VTTSRYINELLAAGIDDEGIERRVLIKQNELEWDLVGAHPFRGEGVKKKSDRIRLFIADYLNYLRRVEGVEAVQVGVEPFSSSSDDDTSWFSPRVGNVSGPDEKYVVSPTRLRERPFEAVWSSVKAMAQKLAGRWIARDPRLTESARDELVQAALVAVWEATFTWQGIEARFSTYAYRAICNAMYDAARVLARDDDAMDSETESPQTSPTVFAATSTCWTALLQSPTANCFLRKRSVFVIKNLTNGTCAFGGTVHEAR
jgi:hypothetical protein